jgi:hypothetical protein
MGHTELQALRRSTTPARVWVAAAVIGVTGAVAWWAPNYPPDPWATFIAWAIWIGAAGLGAFAAAMFGARGKTVAVAAGFAAVVTFLAWPLILFVLVVIGLFLELLTGS